MNADEKVNILLVDDLPSKLLAYEAILGELGENLIKATSAKEALEVLLKQDVAVILVDVCMPEQDGFELVEMIREHHRFQQTAIIFVSAVQMDDLDRIKGYASGAVDYISVPIVPEILRAKVTVFIDLYRKTTQLAKLNLELEERVEERTSELAKTEDALRQADRRKDEFLATLAHELRNPLAPMRTSLDILRQLQIKDPLIDRAAETMERQLSQMTRLIDDLMDVSRITRNRLEMRKERITLSEVLRNGVESSRSIIDAAKQTLTLKAPEEDVFLNADAIRISQVIANLLNNASKYTPDGGKISLEAEADDENVLIKVRDDGIGIDAEDLPHLFEPFYQVSRSVERSQGGLGIGLTLVRTIIEMHGGSVSAQSAGFGKGTEFLVRIPRDVSKQVDQSASNGAATQEYSPRSSRRVLVVDDNRDAAESLTMLLRFSGHEVVTAHDGLQALEDAKEFRPELILMDLGMPGMSGYEAAKALRGEPWGAEIVLVALTGWGQEEDRKRTKEAGFDRHLVKPIEFVEVQKLFGELEDKSLFRAGSSNVQA